MTAPARAAIGGLVLAGGRGSRMGGADKGLLAWGDATLAANALARLRPQVAAAALSANRHLDAYGRLGAPLVEDAAGPDELPPFDGPLAGLLAAFDRCEALRPLPWIAIVPCDVPGLPADLVFRLAAALGGASAAHAASRDPATGDLRDQPLCALVARAGRDALADYLASGRRSARGFLASLGAVRVPFTDATDDPAAFVNANTPGTLDALKGPAKP